MLQPCTPARPAWCTVLRVHHALGITIDSTRQPSAQLPPLGLQAVVGIGRLYGGQALPVSLLQACRLRQQLADFMSDCGLRLVHTQRLRPAHALAALPRHGQRACAALLRMACIIGAPAIRVPALATDEQARSAVAAAFLGHPGAPSDLVPLRLDGLEPGRLYEGRHQARAPRVCGDLLARVALARVGMPASWRMEAGPTGVHQVLPHAASPR